MAKDIRHYKRYCAVICWQGMIRIPKAKVAAGSVDYVRYLDAWDHYCEEVLKEEFVEWLPNKKGPQGGGNPGGP